MKILVENNDKDLLAQGTVDFLEGEVNKDKEPEFYFLATDDNGKEFRVFIKSKTIAEHKQLIKDLEQVLRH